LNCQETQNLIHAYLDGELDLVKSLEIEQHLQGCQACSQTHKNHQALRVAIREGAPYFKSPARLRKRIQASVNQTSQARTMPRAMSWRWVGVMASLALIVILTWNLARGLSAPSTSDLLAQQVVASHVRSLMPNHLVDVVSSDEHTVKPWFDGKLDFSPPVQDLASAGFPLVGGRLDYVDNRPVAALVYQHSPHFINVFIWPSPGSPNTNVVAGMRQGYYLAHWTSAGMTFWAVTDLNQSEFQQFVRLAQSQVTPPPSP